MFSIDDMACDSKTESSTRENFGMEKYFLILPQWLILWLMVILVDS